MKVWNNEAHAYQFEALQFVLERTAAGVFLDPGLGKTSIMLAASKILRETKAIKSVLVIAPLRVCHSVWAANKEPSKWEEFKDTSVEILHGPKKLEALKRKANIYVINPEGLKWLCAQKWPRHFPNMLVVDESTKFKHANTQRFKLLKKMLDQFKRRYILTGTPTPNGLMDLFGQIYVLDEGEALGRYITHFRNQFFFKHGFGGFTYTPNAGAFEEIQRRISPLCIRMDAEDYLELPEKVSTNIPVQLTDKQREQYKVLRDEMVLKLEKGEVTALNAAALTGKCRQFSNGALYIDPTERKAWSEVHTAKLDACEDLIEQLSGEPTLVAYEFKHDLARLRKRFGSDTPYIGGGVSAKRGIEIESQWNKGELPLLLVQPASVAHGLNLQDGGRALIWFGLTYNLEYYDQLIRRIWRQGQAKRSLIYHLITEGTIDQDVIRVMRGKDRSQRAFLKALKREYL